MRELKLSDALLTLHRRPVLVVGQAATQHTAVNSDLLQKLLATFDFGDPPRPFDDFYGAMDYLRIHEPDAITRAHELVIAHFRDLAPAATVDVLAHHQWSAIVSLTSDLALEKALATRYEHVASSWTITLLDNPAMVAPPQTIPVYKLLGNLADQRPSHALAVSTSELLRRKQSWSRLLSSLPDYARDAPYLFVGTEPILNLAREFLSALYANDPPYPSRLLFLKGDRTIDDPTIALLAGEYSEIELIDSTLREFCEATDSIKPLASIIRYSGAKDHAPSFDGQSEWHAALSEFASLVAVVPSQAPSGFDSATNRQRLFDGLFRPTALDWLPYLCDFDFSRSVLPHLLGEVELKIKYLEKSPHPTILIRGEAGVGKTTIAKRLAVELAKQGHIVLWSKRPPSDAYREHYSQLANKLVEIRNKTKHGPRPTVVLLCDDPVSLRLAPHKLIEAFEAPGLPLVSIYIARNSDVLTTEGIAGPLPLKPDAAIQIDHALDSDEFNSLKDYIIKIGVADSSNAQELVDAIPTFDSSDILCSLWYLLPDTRGQLSASLQDEYCRLGGAASAITAIASAATEIGQQARHSYECVAVASGLDIGIPYEVLLRAIHMDYEDWSQMCVDGKPVWGLLYDEIDPVTDNIYFRTRNHVVTKVLLELVNGGVGHAGEFRVLKQLIAGCTVGTIPYRSFLVDLLVVRRKQLQSILSYEQGVELYELALETFPQPDRTIEHHYGSWHRTAGRNPRAAYKQYEKAKNVPSYQYGGRGEREEHIHTSMAAAVVDMVKDGSQDRESALDLVREHLRQASGPWLLDAHNEHVFANMLFTIATTGGSQGADSVSLQSFAEALRTIERALQLIGASGRKKRQLFEDTQALLELQRNILSAVKDVEEVKKYATESFLATGLQAGFEIAGRVLLNRAEQTKNGSDYRLVKDYLDECLAQIESKGDSLSADLRLLRVDLQIRWRLQQPRGPINWEELRTDLEDVLSERRYKDDPIRLYYLALALFQTGEFVQSTAIFNNLKRQYPAPKVRRGLRNTYAGPEGLAKRVQGELRIAHGRQYVYCPEMNIDLECFDWPNNASAGATVHCYIAFSLAGPYAVFSKPDDSATELP